MTKLEELSHVAELAQRLGPDSYLGPWLADCLPMLRDWMAGDFIPDGPLKMHSQAAMARNNAIGEASEILEQARKDDFDRRELSRKQAAAILANAQKEADRIRETAWSALRQATKALEA
jgi:cell division septum initiation protein DivIVA